MASLNKVCLIGNLGRDPEIRFLPSGDAVANFSLAMNETWTKDGKKHEKTEWVAVEAFGKLAEIVRDYCAKGKQVYLEGSLTTQEWSDKEGAKRKTTKVKLSGPRAVLVLLGGGGRGRGEGEREIQRGGEEFQVSDDDVPFSLMLAPVLLPLLGVLVSGGATLA